MWPLHPCHAAWKRDTEAGSVLSRRPGSLRRLIHPPFPPDPPRSHASKVSTHNNSGRNLKQCEERRAIKEMRLRGGIRKRGSMSRGWGWMTRGGRRRGRRGSADLTEIMISILQWLLSLSFGYWWWGDVSAAPWCRAGKKGMKWRCVWKWTVILVVRLSGR